MARYTSVVLLPSFLPSVCVIEPNQRERDVSLCLSLSLSLSLSLARWFGSITHPRLPIGILVSFSTLTSDDSANSGGETSYGQSESVSHWVRLPTDAGYKQERHRPFHLLRCSLWHARLVVMLRRVLVVAGLAQLSRASASLARTQCRHHLLLASRSRPSASLLSASPGCTTPPSRPVASRLLIASRRAPPPPLYVPHFRHQSSWRGQVSH